MLTAYFSGDVSLLEDAFLEIPMLSGEATHELVVQASNYPLPILPLALDPRLAQSACRDRACRRAGTGLQIDSLRDSERARVAVLEVWGRKV